jgi:hypothetical protein
MRKFTLPGLVTYIGSFFLALNARRSVVLAGAIAVGGGTSSHASPGAIAVPDPGLSVVRSGNVVTVSLPGLGLTLFGGQFVNLSLIDPTVFLGNLISIKGQVVTLSTYNNNVDRTQQTWASDLTVYIVTQGLSTDPEQSGSLLQLGGTNGLDATNPTLREFWEPDVNTEYLSSFTQSVDVSAYGINWANLGQPTVWLGNAYTDGNSSGTWTGAIEFTFASSGGSGVPDASRTALLLAPGTLLLLGLAGRSRRRS